MVRALQLGSSVRTDLHQHQVEALHVRRAWASTTVLPRTFAEMVRSRAYRALSSELLVGFDARGPTDESLLLACPALTEAVAACYRGTGPRLRECLDAEGIAVLDWWLATEVRHWGNRWTELDPARTGTAPSTREALMAINEEIRGRSWPDRIVQLVGSIRSVVPSCPPTS